MFGLILIVVVGKYFYKLVEKYDKSKWGYTILGIISYYIGTVLIGFLIGAFFLLMDDIETVDTIPDSIWTIIALPAGLLSCWGVYSFFKKRWEKESLTIKDEINEIGIDQNET